MNRRAFTLVELLLATALAAMLMVGVLMVIVRLGGSAAAAGQPGVALAPSAGDLDAWVELLRSDLQHAGAVETAPPGELSLDGHAGLDAAARQRTHRPVRVTYRLESVNGRAWLVRRQAPLDVRTNQTPQRDLVCAGLSRFEVTPAAGVAARGAGAGPAGVTAWRLRAWVESQEQPVCDRTLLVSRSPGP